MSGAKIALTLWVLVPLGVFFAAGFAMKIRDSLKGITADVRAKRWRDVAWRLGFLLWIVGAVSICIAGGAGL